MIIRFKLRIFIEDSLSKIFSFSSSHPFKFKGLSKNFVEFMNPASAFYFVGTGNPIDIIFQMVI